MPTIEETPCIPPPSDRLAGVHARPGGWLLISVLAVEVVLGPAPGFAQNIPPAVREPGLIERELLERAPLPQAQPPIELPEEPPLVPAPGSDQVFTLKGIVLDGNTVFDAADLAPTWERYLGQEVPVSVLYDVAAAITARYRNAGYVLSRAVVPPQEIDASGIGQIQVVEGYISDVIIQGDPTGPEAQLEEKFERIKESRPLRGEVLERYMLLINDLPSLAAQAVLRPSPVVTGASELLIFIEQSKFATSLSVDNFASDFLGPFRFGGVLTFNNIFDLYDSTELRGVISADLEELRFISLVHTEQIGTEGTVLSVGGSYTETEPGESLSPLAVEGESFGGSLFVTHPFIRTRSENLSVTGGFRLRNSETEDFSGTFSDDQIRSINLGATYDLVDQFRGVNLIGAQVAQGLDVLDARATPPDDVSFTWVLVDLVREQSLARFLPSLSLLVAARGQYAFDDRLPAAEEFGFGGEDFGRGYDPFVIVGDAGVAGKLELRYGTSLDLRYLEGYQLFTFYDAGVVWQNDRTPDEEARESGTSTGFGVRLNFAYDVTADALVGFPLTRPPTTEEEDQGDEKEPRFFFRVSKRF
jgi:hemolysin activation/secretion protein